MSETSNILRKEALLKIADEARGDVMEMFRDACEKKILEMRDGEALPEKKRNEIARQSKIDSRPLLLSSISGKGGWHQDSQIMESRSRFDNVSLLDHMVSVARGAMVFEGISIAERLSGMPDFRLSLDEGLSFKSEKERAGLLKGYMTTRLGYAFALGFLHDANKIDGVDSNKEMGSAEIEKIAITLGVDDFLEKISKIPGAENLRGRLGRGETLWDPAAMAYEISMVESNTSYSQSLRETGAVPYEQAARAVRLADRLDGKFLLGGAKAALEELSSVVKSFGPELANGLGDWEEKTIREPQFPMLLDELRREISRACWSKEKVWPLICMTRDGELTALLPKGKADEIWEDAVDGVIRERLPFRPSVMVNNRLALSISGGAKTLEDVRQALEGGERILSISKAFKETLEQPDANGVIWLGTWNSISQDAMGTEKPDPNSVKEMLKEMGAVPALESLSGKSFWLQGGKGSSAKNRGGMALACVAVIAWDPDIPKGIKARTPQQRMLDWEKAASALGVSMTFPMSQILQDEKTTLGAATFAVLDVLSSPQFHGESSQAKANWDAMMNLAESFFLEVEPFQTMATMSGNAKNELRQRFLGESPVGPQTGKPSGTEYRCIFTDEIVGEDRKLEAEFLLPHIKSSAFSGRSGRPDHLMSAPAKGVTHVGVMAQIEGALAAAGMGMSGEIGIRVVSPNGSGLFGTIERQRAKGNVRGYSSFDLLRESASDGLVFSGMESYFQPMRVGTAEKFPGKLFNKKDDKESQAGFFLRWMKAARRYGKPIHLFRGLPEHRKEFFFCDCMPSELEEIVGGSGLRIEQLGVAIDRLEAVISIVESLGQDAAKIVLGDRSSKSVPLMAMLRRLEQAKDGGVHVSRAIGMVKGWISNLEQEGKNMDKNLGAGLAECAKSFAVAQRTSGWDMSNSEAGMCWNLSWEGLEQSKRMGLSEEESLAIIAGHVEKSLDRKGKLARGEAAASAIETGVRAFLRLYGGPLKRKTPASREMGVLRDAYMWIFEREIKERIRRAKEAKEISGVLDDARDSSK